MKRKIKSIHVLLIAAVLTILTGLIAGVYPALVLSSFKPAKVLSGEFKSGNKGIIIRKILITIQFGLTVFLLITTAIMKDQLQYFLGKDIGYNKENLISISLKGGTSKGYTNFKNRLITEPGVINVTGSNAPFPYFNWSSGANDWEGKDPNLDINTSNNFVDYDFSFRAPVQMSYHVQERCFSTARWPHNCHHIPFLDSEV